MACACLAFVLQHLMTLPAGLGRTASPGTQRVKAISLAVTTCSTLHGAQSLWNLQSSRAFCPEERLPRHNTCTKCVPAKSTSSSSCRKSQNNGFSRNVGVEGAKYLCVGGDGDVHRQRKGHTVDMVWGWRAQVSRTEERHSSRTELIEPSHFCLIIGAHII